MAAHAASDFAVSVVSFHEQVLGCQTYLGRAKSSADVVRGYGVLMEVLAHYAGVPLLPFDAAASAVFDTLTRQRVRVGTMDLRIASIALSRGLTVLTRNLSDFRKVPGLASEDWTV